MRRKVVVIKILRVSTEPQGSIDQQRIIANTITANRISNQYDVVKEIEFSDEGNNLEKIDNSRPYFQALEEIQRIYDAKDFDVVVVAASANRLFRTTSDETIRAYIASRFIKCEVHLYFQGDDVNLKLYKRSSAVVKKFQNLVTEGPVNKFEVMLGLAANRLVLALEKGHVRPGIQMYGIRITRNPKILRGEPGHYVWSLVPEEIRVLQLITALMAFQPPFDLPVELWPSGPIGVSRTADILNRAMQHPEYEWISRAGYIERHQASIANMGAKVLREQKKAKLREEGKIVREFSFSKTWHRTTIRNIVRNKVWDGMWEMDLRDHAKTKRNKERTYRHPEDAPSGIAKIAVIDSKAVPFNGNLLIARSMMSARGDYLKAVRLDQSGDDSYNFLLRGKAACPNCNGLLATIMKRGIPIYVCKSCRGKHAFWIRAAIVDSIGEYIFHHLYPNGINLRDFIMEKQVSKEACLKKLTDLADQLKKLQEKRKKMSVATKAAIMELKVDGAPQTEIEEQEEAAKLIDEKINQDISRLNAHIAEQERLLENSENSSLKAERVSSMLAETQWHLEAHTKISAVKATVLHELIRRINFKQIAVPKLTSYSNDSISLFMRRGSIEFSDLYDQGICFNRKSARKIYGNLQPYSNRYEISVELEESNFAGCEGIDLIFNPYEQKHLPYDLIDMHEPEHDSIDGERIKEAVGYLSKQSIKSLDDLMAEIRKGQ